MSVQGSDPGMHGIINKDGIRQLHDAYAFLTSDVASS